MSAFDNEITDVSSENTEQFLRRCQSMTLRTGTKIMLLQGLTAAIKTGMGATEFFSREVQRFDEIDTKQQSGLAYLLDGRPDGKKFCHAIHHMFFRLNFSLPEAMEYFPRIWDAQTLTVVRAGHEKGNLDEILAKQVKFMAKIQKANAKLIQLMLYPIIIMSVALLVGGLLFVFVLPKMQDIFQSVGDQSGKLGIWADSLIAVTNFINSRAGIVTAATIGALITGYLYVRRYEKIRRLEGLCSLWVPWWRSYAAKMQMYAFGNAVAVLRDAGGVESLAGKYKIAAHAVSNFYLRELILKAVCDYENDLGFFGECLANACPLFSRTTNWFRTFELCETQGEDQAFKDYLDWLDYSADLDREKLATLIPNVALIVCGGFVIWVLLAMYSPILHVIGKLAR